jgi:hypothetical protein
MEKKILATIGIFSTVYGKKNPRDHPPRLYPTAHLGDVRYFGVLLGIARAR